ncbi:MAG: 16S rRNA (cytosine(967)-C(5))-methyltransferase RsmB [Armatimonadota bacterium]|nr:16S rRNA (cytosine(967)-C(5))-methyltransferase RsmB [Armatimonadota bacterium]MDR5696655.1 16S rRNA (cytosine(967)-C(5))-methyltransferase RsmB [Armatimonadota bacterium]
MVRGTRPPAVARSAAPRTGREAALEVLDAVETGAFSNVALLRTLERASLPAPEAALATELALGVLRWRGRVDYALAGFLREPFGRLPPAIRQILRLGAYQILFLDRIPAHAAVNESVEMAKRRGHRRSAALVNAVLRALAASGEPPPPAAPDEALAIRGSHPLWLVRRWIARWGIEQASAVCAANNGTPPTFLRVNTLRASPQQAVQALAAAGVTVEPGSLPESLRVTAGSLPDRMPLVAGGVVVAQDEGSMAVVRALAPEPGETVVDACAAPGGKSTHIAAVVANRGRVIACDVTDAKVRAIRQAVDRAGAGCVEPTRADARDLPVRDADRVLVDAPCTGLGVVRRRPEIRWRIREQHLRRASARQREILAGAAGAVRRGGVLVYAVCSTEPEEGPDVVQWWVAQGEFSLEPFSIPWRSDALAASDGTLLLLPHLHGTDSFFVARMRRT